MLAFILALLYVTYDTFTPITEVECLAFNVYHEAKGESYEGKLAVANVTSNRVKSKYYPNTYCGVVKAYKQFSWYWDGKSDAVVLRNHIDEKAWAESVTAALDVITNQRPDNTNGSTHYYAHETVYPYWADSMTTIAVIDNHTFLK